MTRRFLPALLTVLALAGCAGAARHIDGPALAQAAGWQWRIVAAGAFDVAVVQAPQPRAETLIVYLEGDGFAYVNAHRPSQDPTPTDPVALRLALGDPHAGAAWIARPCQYTLPDHGRGCAQALWTKARYSQAVIDALNDAVDQLKHDAAATRIVLVGYSGGGALAVLLAATRTDVAAIVTVVANLDLDYWTQRDGLSPLSESLDPAAMAGRVATIPQLHFTGAKDHVVGTDVATAFMRHLPAGAPAQLVEVPDFDHICCWATAWPDLLRRNPIPGLHP